MLAYIELDVKESASTVRERAKKEVNILNSILISLNSEKEGLKLVFAEVNYWLEVNENDKKCMDRAAILLQEVIKRSQHHLVKASVETLSEIVDLACQKAFVAVCGHSYISLLQQISFRINLLQNKAISLTFLNFLLSPKLLVSTYRQETRLCLYKIYLNLLSRYADFDQCWEQN